MLINHMSWCKDASVRALDFVPFMPWSFQKAMWLQPGTNADCDRTLNCRIVALHVDKWNDYMCWGETGLNVCSHYPAAQLSSSTVSTYQVQKRISSADYLPLLKKCSIIMAGTTAVITLHHFFRSWYWMLRASICISMTEGQMRFSV